MADKQKADQKALTKTQLAGIIFTGLIVIGFWLINLFCLKDNLGKDNINDRGTFGDMFGAVNALFSGLAFAGIIWTIFLQRNELKLQREENSLSRDEAIEQNKTLKLQRFENTFFNMLNLQNEIVKNLKFQQLEGRQVVDEAQKRLFAYLNWENYQKAYNDKHSIPPENLTTHTVPTSFSNARSILNNSFHQKFYNNFASNFNHYFRHLYHIFKFIYFSDLDISEKNFYASLTRAQLSQNELYLISFNMLIEDYGHPKFLYLIREFDILQNFDKGEVTPLPFKELMDYELKMVRYPFNDLLIPKQKNF